MNKSNEYETYVIEIVGYVHSNNRPQIANQFRRFPQDIDRANLPKHTSGNDCATSIENEHY